jgi:hypothetical protein
VRFLLFVEGHTEDLALGPFLQKWLNARLKTRVGITPINLKGNRFFSRDIKDKVDQHLGDDSRNEIIAAVGLLDLYKGAPNPTNAAGVEEQYRSGVRYFEEMVGQSRFRMFFAVHETEAWLFSDPGIFPREVRERIPTEFSQRPESVNFQEPPAQRLTQYYRSAQGHKYKKRTYGRNLFAKLEPEHAYDKCPHLKLMLDTMLDLAKRALKEN